MLVNNSPQQNGLMFFYGSLRMTEFDCNYEKCPNNAACLIYREAREREKGV